MTAAAAPGSASTTPDELVTSVDGSATVTRRELGRRARAWMMYDIGNSAFQAIIVTFVFSTYLASDLFLSPDVVALGDADPQNPAYLAAQADSTSVISLWITIGGIVVALLAPVLGQLQDGAGRRKFWLGAFSGIVIAVMLAMYLIAPGQPLLVWGAVLLAVGTVFAELAAVSYNAMLNQVATRENVGRISGLGWGLGYLGTIVLLLVLLVLFIQSFGVAGHGGVLAVPSGAAGEALNIRLAVVASAIWFLGFLVPVLVRVPEAPRHAERPRHSLVSAYVALFRTLARLARETPKLLLFLVSSAVFRDGLTAIFTFGAILAAQVYGFTSTEVIYFAVAANLVAGLGTLASGWFDDRFSPKAVMTWSLVSLVVVAGVILLTPSTKPVFWALGLFLCLFVGPVQSASRSYLAQATPPGREGELFGLYATTNRVASFITPALFGLVVAITGQTKLGVIGIAVVLVAGLLLLLPVPRRHPVAEGASAGAEAAASD